MFFPSLDLVSMTPQLSIVLSRHFINGQWLYLTKVTLVPYCRKILFKQLVAHRFGFAETKRIIFRIMETSCRMKPISRLPTARSTIGLPVEEQYTHCTLYVEEHKEDSLLLKSRLEEEQCEQCGHDEQREQTRLASSWHVIVVRIG